MHSLTQTRIAFTKMHGAGNDFVILDARRDTPAFTAAQIARLSDRRRGIGCDQLILLETPQNPDADIAMRIHNQDATIAGACGNATRCVAALLAEQTGRTQFTIETAAGLLQADILPNAEIRIDMGPAHLAWSEIPLASQCDTLHTPIPGDPACVSIGNPHATLFVPDLAAINPATLGPDLEQHPIFPERANIGFAQILAPDRIRLRVWERGAGLTLACGSGACAALVNAHRRGLTGRTARLDLDGGTLHIEWRATDGHVLMTGPAATAFRGIFDFADLHA